MLTVSIGEAAAMSGVKVPTIRYYENIGLLPSPPRTESNRRVFSEEEVARLRFIRHARELGFELPAIRELLKLQSDPSQSCTAADTIARARLADVERRIRSLNALKRELKAMIESCSCGTVAQCRVIEVLADHARCESDDHN